MSAPKVTGYMVRRWKNKEKGLREFNKKGVTFFFVCLHSILFELQIGLYHLTHQIICFKYVVKVKWFVKLLSRLG